jgi:hypothetical protein
MPINSYETVAMTTDASYWCRRIAEYNYVNITLIVGTLPMGVFVALAGLAKKFRANDMGNVARELEKHIDKDCYL